MCLSIFSQNSLSLFAGHHLFASVELNDPIIGVILLISSLFMLCFCLICVVKILHTVMKGSTSENDQKNCQRHLPETVRLPLWLPRNSGRHRTHFPRTEQLHFHIDPHSTGRHRGDHFGADVPVDPRSKHRNDCYGHYGSNDCIRQKSGSGTANRILPFILQHHRNSDLVSYSNIETRTFTSMQNSRQYNSQVQVVRSGLSIWDVSYSSGVDIWCLFGGLASLGRCLYPHWIFIAVCDCYQCYAEEVSSDLAEANANVGLFAVVDALSRTVRQANDIHEQGSWKI